MGWMSRLFVNSPKNISYLLHSTTQKISTKPRNISMLDNYMLRSCSHRGYPPKSLLETSQGKLRWTFRILHTKHFHSQPNENKDSLEKPIQWKESALNKTQTEDSFYRLPIGSLEEQSEIVNTSSGIYDHLITFWQGYVNTSANVLEFLYETLGVPWFALIGMTTIAVRLLLLPIAIGSMRSIAVMKCLKPQLEEIYKRTTDATSRQNDEKLLELKNEYLKLMKKYKADPLKNFYAPLIQTPIIMSLYWGVRSLTKSNPISLSEGGIGWFQDLTVPDPHYILPLLCSTIYLITLRIAKDTMAVTSTSIDILLPFTQQLLYLFVELDIEISLY
ncbi:preprotein translocase, Oxa1 family [Galdieria sulphuraria]|uniref:Preprotein translocase, Oxa1 family n=1 Tax=Galdieria sulphuraria TaxID=130081 RepID=M2XSU1_GALSU|nr:preprotein translocase, Oxa1 family [Galdieria sulphuraria]EME26484.1 preprotein translocase, Oxa1 family [Galdieria sulphuraria]|eukprot:XP_005703004.1 preprotein translocase, Oxa1 family [Galdieria sulphuraria]